MYAYLTPLSCLGTWMSSFDKVLNACSSWWALLNEPIALGSLLPAVRPCTNSLRRKKNSKYVPSQNQIDREQMQIMHALAPNSMLQHLWERECYWEYVKIKLLVFCTFQLLSPKFQNCRPWKALPESIWQNCILKDSFLPRVLSKRELVLVY